ncbi:class I SAM-dependent methyltransferase [Nitriliruptoraceae bacterium ZYF776]|nr:class I SAM-dependent methyltransferase [Profundirhabdus halotolerans]
MPRRSTVRRPSVASPRCGRAPRHGPGPTTWRPEVASGDRRVHPTAAGFERAAASYERARPGYPPVVLDRLRRDLDLRPDRTVLDLGAGTGKLTRELVATGADVVAAEPVAGMRVELARLLPTARVLDAPAEDLPLPDASVDAATAAQAFHWFDAPRALDEVHRVLRPDATFAVLHNRRALDTPAQAVIDAIRTPLRRDTPSWDDHTWEQHLRADDRFTVHEDAPVRQIQRVSLDLAVERVASVSFVAGLDDDARTSVLDEVRARLAPLVEADGRLALVHDTEVVRLVRGGAR